MKPNRVLMLLLLTGLTAMTAALPSDPAWAKTGNGASAGSRGSKTFSPVAPAPSQTTPGTGSFLQHNSSSSAAQPITRSTTPPPVQAAPTGPAVQSESLAPMAAPRQQVTPTAPVGIPGQAMPSPRSSFMSGLAGGLIGAGIGSMIFGGGHSFFGEGGGGFLGAMIQLGLIFFVGRWLLRKFLGNRPVAQPTGYRRMDFDGETNFAPKEPSFGAPKEPSFGEPTLGGAGFGAPAMTAATATDPRPANPRQFVLSEQDLGAIETLLMEIQAVWTAGDVASLQRLATPEMAGYFNEQLTEDRARGLENRVEQVHLLKGDVNETWREGPLDYATVTLQWTAIDYTLSHAGAHPGAVVAGNPDSPVEMTEVWTVLRSPGAPWILSAIQQV